MLDTRYAPETLIKSRFHRMLGDRRAATPNERMILSQILRRPDLPRAALSRTFNISQQSVHRIIQRLDDRGILTLGALAPPTHKGKPSPRLSLNPRHACAIGLSINTDSAGITLVDFAGTMTTRSLGIEGQSMARTLAQIDEVIHDLLQATGFSRSDIFGIGFAISGFVIEGTRYSAPKPLKEWSMPQLGPTLAQHFRLPVWTENGANTGALYESMFGLGQRYANFAYLSFNYGFGGGIIVDGNLMRGGFGNAGELSGMFTMAEMKHRPGLRSLLEELRRNDVDITSIHELAARFDPNWPGVTAWLDRVTEATCRVVNVLGAVVDPEVIVFGGQIPPPLADMLIARAQFYRTEGRYGIIRRQPEMLVSQMGGETAAMGAAMLPFKACYF
ncbi:MAG: ROK family transcriptional regulator [Pseudomonadota bacterium]